MFMTYYATTVEKVLRRRYFDPKYEKYHNTCDLIMYIVHTSAICKLDELPEMMYT